MNTNKNNVHDLVNKVGKSLPWFSDLGIGRLHFEVQIRCVWMIFMDAVYDGYHEHDEVMGLMMDGKQVR